jgi:hypothetical protein
MGISRSAEDGGKGVGIDGGGGKGQS